MTNKGAEHEPVSEDPVTRLALSEYEYAKDEIHLRLGFNRQVLNLQITMLAALVGGTVAFLDKHTLSPALIQIGSVAALYLNLAFILEIRQNSLHTIISGNFILRRLPAVLPKSYFSQTDGGLLANIRKYREHGRARKVLFHYWSDSFLLVSTLTLISACAGILWTAAGRALDWLAITDIATGSFAVIASIVNLWGYTISDPRYVREAMQPEAAAHHAERHRHGT